MDAVPGELFARTYKIMHQTRLRVLVCIVTILCHGKAFATAVTGLGSYDSQVNTKWIVDGTFDGVDTTLDWTSSWKHHVEIEEFNVLGDDDLIISGSLYHIVPPHGEGANECGFEYNFEIDAGDYTGPLVMTGSPCAHKDHFDQGFKATLNLNVTEGIIFDDIDSYTLTVVGVHVVPLPSTALLLCSGLAVLAVRRRRGVR